jgi:hypothetical protein
VRTVRSVPPTLVMLAHAQLRINSRSSAVPTIETAIDPAQPSLFEKKTNT